MKTLEQINADGKALSNDWRAGRINKPEYEKRALTLENEVKVLALQTSKENPSKILIVRFVFFAAFFYLRSRVWTDDPGNSVFDGYFKNGELRPFTKSQRMRYQNSGITCQ